VLVPPLALAAAVASGSSRALLYVHVMAGVPWTGIDVFLGTVLGGLALVTVAGGVLVAGERGLFPYANAWLALSTAATLIPVVLLAGRQFDALGSRRFRAVAAAVTLGSLAAVAVTLPDSGMTVGRTAATLLVVALLSINGFGLVLPGEVRIYRETAADEPDTELIGAIGLRNARLGGVQGALQLAIVVLMVGLRTIGLGL